MKELLNNPYLWLAVVIALAALVGLALWIGRGLKIHADKGGFDLEVKEQLAPPESSGENKTDVASGTEIKQSEVGNIIGERTECEERDERGRSVTVAKGSKVTKSKVGDIVGIERKGKKS